MDGSPFPMAGSGAVGLIEDLTAIEAGAVIALRLACEAQDHPARLDFEGLKGGRAAVLALVSFAGLCGTYGRRPLMRHALTCRCLGGDEACVARVVAASLSADRNDAMLLASLLVRADMAPFLVAEAERAGVALAQMAAAPADMSEAATYH